MQAHWNKAFFFRLFVIVLSLFCMSLTVFADDAQPASVYCFSEDDFEQNADSTLSGIYVVSVPDVSTASVQLGSRMIRAGDVLSYDSLSALTLRTPSGVDGEAVLCYLPLYGSSIGNEQTLNVCVRSGKAGVPTAEDVDFETYKNIANDGSFRANDEQDEPLTFSVGAAPKLGTVEVHEDGTFLYTPMENKVGKDSFTYTVTDKDGNVSAPATVHITIKKATKEAFFDMAESDSSFEAQWMLEQGLYSGKLIAESPCFCPEQTVSRGEFLVMAMKLAGLKPESELSSGFIDEAKVPAWQRGYLASAMRHGIVTGVPTDDGLCFCADEPMTGSAAAVMIQKLTKVKASGEVAVFAAEDAIPAWAVSAVSALTQAEVCPIECMTSSALSYADCAALLYGASRFFE